LSVRTNKGDSNLKRALDDEAYSKIKALAALGERDRQLQYSYNHSKVTKTTKSDVNQYQKLLEQKNTQVDDLQRKVRDLLAAQSKSTAAASSASTVREKQLKSNYEIESYEKVRAFAGWGEAERKLSLVKPEAQAPDTELAPLRRRTEQQESIIVDLRKRLDLQQKQSEEARRSADQKYSLLQRQNETDIATLRADASDDSARVEVDSYKRKVSELELAGQNRIKEFNTTLEKRNQEYDQLGNRLEDLRKQVVDRDGQITTLKSEVEKNRQLKTTTEADINKYREKVGALEIDLKERDATIVRLQGTAADLEQSNVAVRDMENRLAGFTRDSEQTSKKYEGVITEQRGRISELESDVINLKNTVTDKEKEIVPLRQAVKDGENKISTVTADVNRFRTEVTGKSSELKKVEQQLAAAKDDHQK